MSDTINKIKIPTGYLFTDKYAKGELETLSIGDYGKAHNVKADFLGLKREIHGAPNMECMPLHEKWVITLSTQYGCTQYVKWPDQVVEVDSGSFCPYSDSGSYYPVLVRTTWTGTNSACSVVQDDPVVGGLKGIRRHFGCYRKPIAHPVPVVTECADCGWPK